MKDLTLDLVREVYKFHIDNTFEIDEYTDKFMDLVHEFRNMEPDQIMIRARDLKREHIGKYFSLLGGPILGVLNDVPNPKPASRDDDDPHRSLRGHDGYFVVVNSKFVSLPNSQIVILETVEPSDIKD